MLEIFAVIAEDRIAQAGLDHVQHLVEHDLVLLDIRAEPFDFVRLVAAANADIEPPAGHRIDQGDFRDHPRRGVQRQDQNGATDPDCLRHRRGLIAQEQR